MTRDVSGDLLTNSQKLWSVNSWTGQLASGPVDWSTCDWSIHRLVN